MFEIINEVKATGYYEVESMDEGLKIVKAAEKRGCDFGVKKAKTSGFLVINLKRRY